MVLVFVTSSELCRITPSLFMAKGGMRVLIFGPNNCKSVITSLLAGAVFVVSTVELL